VTEEPQIGAWPHLGRRLRLAVLGGGPGSFIGPIHRAAARLDDRFEIVAGMLSSDPARNAEGAAALGIRAYPSLAALADAGVLDDDHDFIGERFRYVSPWKETK
jgi:hypothetical protein